MREYLNVFCIVYIDDLLIFFNDKKTYKKHVRLIFEKLRKFKLFANLKKCFFDLNKIDYLKYWINTMKIKRNFVKIQIINIRSKSNLYKNIQIFINFVNFYKRFINELNSIAAFFTDMLKKKKFYKNFEFTSTTRKEFNSLKNVFIVALIFWYFDFKFKIKIEIKVSKFERIDIINQLIKFTGQ